MIVVEGSHAPGPLGQRRGVGQEGGAQGFRLLEPQSGQLGSDERIAPLRGELLFGHRTVQAARAGQHPLQAGAAPEAAVRESVAKTPDDRLGLREPQLIDGQPVGQDTALSQPVVGELKILTGVEVGDPRAPQGRRFSRDEVESLVGRLQKEATVLDVTRTRGSSSGGGVSGKASGPELEDVARDIHHVNRLELPGVGQRLGGGADAVADQQRLARAGLTARLQFT